MPRLWKAILAPACYFVRCQACGQGKAPDGKPCRLCGGVGSLPVEYTSQDCQDFCATGKAMLSAGLQIPIPLEHDMTADPTTAAAASVVYNTGFVRDWRIESDGSLSAELDVDFIPEPGFPDRGIRDPEEIRHRLEKTIRFVSPMIDPAWPDMTGKVWRGITHVALTPQPVWYSQAPFAGQAAGSDGAVLMSQRAARRVLRPRSWALRGRQALSLASCWYCRPDVGRAIAWDETDWPILMAAAHAPKGGISIGGKFFPGGRFIPAAEMAKASPEERKAVEEPAEARRGKMRQMVGNPDRDALGDKVKPWNGLELKAHQLTEAKRTWASLKSYHGDLALHRLHQLVHNDTLKVEGMAAGHARTRLERRLRAYGHMLMWHQEGEASKAEAFKASKRGVQVVSKGQLHVDPERFQYKLNVNKAGTVREGSATEGVKRFRPEFAGVLLAWHDPADGKDYVVNGHHRYAIAKGDDKIDNLGVYFIEAKDAKEARKIGALANIAEGRGTATDAAKLIRDEGFTPEDFQAEGVSLKGTASRDAFTLAKLSDGLFKKLTLGTLEPKQALAIGGIENHEHQEQFAKWLDKQDRDIPDKVLGRMAQKIQNTSGAKTKTATLFGEDEADENLFLHRTTLETHVLAKLASEANLFGAVSTEKKADQLAGRAENVLDVGRNAEISAEAKSHRALLQRLVDLKGPVADAFNHAAEELHASPKQRKAIEERLLGRVRGALQQELTGTAGSGAAAAAGGSEAGAGGGGDLAAGAGAPGGESAPAGELDSTAKSLAAMNTDRYGAADAHAKPKVAASMRFARAALSRYGLHLASCRTPTQFLGLLGTALKQRRCTLLSMRRRVTMSGFDESKVNRDELGEFAVKGGAKKFERTPEDEADEKRRADARAERAVRLKGKQPWQMKRSVWESIGMPMPDPKELENTLEAERKAMGEFFGLFADPLEAAREGTIEPDPSTYAKTRDEAFEKGMGKEPSFRSKFPLLPRLKKAGMEQMGEDARLAIAYGRKLGYRDEDIAHYLIRNYIRGGDRLLDSDRPASKKMMAEYPELRGRKS